MQLFTWILMFALVLIVGNGRFLDAKTSDSPTMAPLQD